MKTLLFNPFERYLEKTLILGGTLLTLLGSGIAYLMRARFDGVLDLHFVPEIEWWQPFLDNLINILCLSVMLFIAAKIINGKTRFVDILAASIVAKIPYYFLLAFNINGFLLDATTNMVDHETLQILEFSMGDLVAVLFFAFCTFLILVWFIILLYNGYRVASHAKGVKSVVLFIASIILAEIASKYLILQFT